MTIYGGLLFLHVLAAMASAAALLGEQLALGFVRDASSGPELRRGLQALRPSLRLGMAAMLTLLLSGAALMKMSWGTAPWLLVAFGLLAALPLLGVLSARRLRTLLRASADAHAAEQVLAGLEPTKAFVLKLSLRLRVLIVLGIVFLMTVKPALSVALAVACVVATIGLLLIALGSREAAGRTRATAVGRGRSGA